MNGEDGKTDLTAELDSFSSIFAGLSGEDEVGASLEEVRVGALSNRPDDPEKGTLYFLLDERLLTQYRGSDVGWVSVGGIGRADDRLPETYTERMDVSEELVIPMREAHDDIKESDEGIVYVEEENRLIHRVVE